MDKFVVATRSIYEGPHAVAADLGVGAAHVSRISAEVFGQGGIKRYRARIRRVLVPDDVATLAYVAGIIDGEGWVSKTTAGWKLGVANTHRGVCEWLVEKIGGHISERGERGREIFRSVKCSYQWSLQRQPDVLAVLVAIEPFMIIKKEKAQKAVDDLLEWWVWGNGSWSDPVVKLPGDGQYPVDMGP